MSRYPIRKRVFTIALIALICIAFIAHVTAEKHDDDDDDRKGNNSPAKNNNGNNGNGHGNDHDDDDRGHGHGHDDDHDDDDNDEDEHGNRRPKSWWPFPIPKCPKGKKCCRDKWHPWYPRCPKPTPEPNYRTALADYCKKPDKAYNWTFLLAEPNLYGATVNWINLTSQAWLTPNDNSRSIWWHYMAVVVPAVVSFPSNGVVYVTGGSNENPRPAANSGDLQIGVTLATLTQTVVTILYQVPNQPIVFADDPTHDPKSEDRMVAYTWTQFMANTSRPESLARLPMTKSALKAMDATTAFRLKSGFNITKYSITGGSKRGWVAWLAAAVNPERIISTIPMVLDELNFVKNIKHHWKAYGGWSYALSSYTELNVTLKWDTPEMAKLMLIEDPYAYNITMPKFIITGSGDEFLQTDNNYYYWNGLPGEKHYIQLPNFSHSLSQNPLLVVQTIAAFVNKLQQNQARPDYFWERRTDGSLFLRIANTNLPQTVLLYTASSIKQRRDFRTTFWNRTTNSIQASTVNFTPVPFANTSSDAKYTYWLVPPQPVPAGAGWVGFNLQVAFPPVASGQPQFRFSTATQILPDVLPFPECFGVGCYQTNFV